MHLLGDFSPDFIHLDSTIRLSSIDLLQKGFRCCHLLKYKKMYLGNEWEESDKKAVHTAKKLK